MANQRKSQKNGEERELIHKAFALVPFPNVPVMRVCTGECYGVKSVAAQAQTAPTLLRRKQVGARTGLARTIYQHVRAGAFSALISHGAKSIGWIEAEVKAWLDARIGHSRKA